MKPDIREEALARRAQQGDDVAFDSLVDFISPRLFNYAFRLLGNRDDADDITMEALMRIYNALPRYKWDNPINTWMFQIIKNLCYDHMKKNNRKPLSFSEITAEDGDEPEFVDLNSNPADIVLKSADAEIIHKAINELSPDAREVLTMFDIQGMSYLEIADILNLNMGTIKSRLNRARHTLCEKLEKSHGTLFAKYQL